MLDVILGVIIILIHIIQPKRCKKMPMNTCRLIIIDINSLQLEITISVVGSSRVDAVLVTDNFPELKKV